MIDKMFGWMKLHDKEPNNIDPHEKDFTYDPDIIASANNTLQQIFSEDLSIATLETNDNLAQEESENVADSTFMDDSNLDLDDLDVEIQNTTTDEASEDIFQNESVPEELDCKKIVEDNVSVETDETYVEDTNVELPEEQPTYRSKRKLILGVHLQFIDIAREVVAEQRIKAIPLMREYHLEKSSLEDIIRQLHEANIIGQYGQILMTPEELEKFLDIYDPTLFDCKHTVFDRDIFLCIGEIIFDKGVDDVYDSMNEDELLDYLDILEKFKMIAYNPDTNEYDITSTKEDFLNICECIPQSFSNKKYEIQDQDYQDKNYDEMSGLEFERYCGYLLQKNAFTDIKITQASGDHGIDILAEKSGISYAFQCKCYSDNVGNDAIQQAHTGKCLYHMDIAVVITNRYFTQQAQDEAKQLGVKLWDRDKLNELIKFEC